MIISYIFLNFLILILILTICISNAQYSIRTGYNLSCAAPFYCDQQIIILNGTLSKPAILTCDHGCDESVIICEQNCKIECGLTFQVCERSTFICGGSTPCTMEIDCTNENSCWFAVFHCRDGGNCTVNCGERSM